MILHASITFFNGEEFLKPCVRNLEGVVDHITVLWQDVSYRGNPISEEALTILDGLSVNKIHYPNDSEATGHENETAKRNLGLDAARNFGATHHLDLDVDEFYFHPQLEYAKDVITSKDIDSTACRIYEYHSDIHWRCPEWRPDMFVGLIHKLHPETHFINGGTYPVRIDPTRRVNTCDNFHAFEPQDVCMHHYTLVRKHMCQAKMIDSNGYVNNMRRLQTLNSDEENYENVPDYFGIERNKSES